MIHWFIFSLEDPVKRLQMHLWRKLPLTIVYNSSKFGGDGISDVWVFGAPKENFSHPPRDTKFGGTLPQALLYNTPKFGNIKPWNWLFFVFSYISQYSCSCSWHTHFFSRERGNKIPLSHCGRKGIISPLLSIGSLSENNIGYRFLLHGSYIGRLYKVSPSLLVVPKSSGEVWFIEMLPMAWLPNCRTPFCQTYACILLVWYSPVS